MHLTTKRKWEGFFSLAWVSAGFVALKLSDFYSGSTVVVFFLVFGAWWGVGMLLAVSGLRSRSPLSMLAALITSFWFAYFMWSLIPKYNGRTH